MSRWLIPKAVLAMLLVAGFAAAQRIFYPAVLNPSAVEQVEDSASSYIGVAPLDTPMRIGWPLILAIFQLPMK